MGIARELPRPSGAQPLKEADLLPIAPAMKHVAHRLRCAPRSHPAPKGSLAGRTDKPDPHDAHRGIRGGRNCPRGGDFGAAGGRIRRGREGWREHDSGCRPAPGRSCDGIESSICRAAGQRRAVTDRLAIEGRGAAVVAGRPRSRGSRAGGANQLGERSAAEGGPAAGLARRSSLSADRRATSGPCQPA